MAMRQILDAPDLASMDRARQDPAVRACLLTLQTLDHDLTDTLAGLPDVALVLLPRFAAEGSTAVRVGLAAHPDARTRQAQVS